MAKLAGGSCPRILVDRESFEYGTDLEILYRPWYSLGKMAHEGGSMVSMPRGTDPETGGTGSLWRTLSRILFGGETFFQCTSRAFSGGGTVWVT